MKEWMIKKTFLFKLMSAVKVVLRGIPNMALTR